MVTSHNSARALVLVGVVSSLGIGGCCFGGSTPAVTPPPGTPPVPGIAVPGTPPPPPAAGAQAINLAPGFAPDPTTVSVIAGGPVSGSTMGAADGWCAGNYPAAAQITLTTGAIAGLRIVGRSDQDTTLAIRLADGRVFCNDDGGGYPNPALDASIVTGGIPAGTHQVYVGSFGSSGQGAPATIGFTVNAGLMPAPLP
jgi:hypothetical protein